MLYPKYRINVMLRDAISQTGPTPRLAGMIHKDGMLTCYMHGAEKFKYNPETDEITLFPPYHLQGSLIVDEFKIDTELCKQLYYKSLTKRRVEKEDEDAVIKEELGITKKSLNEKDREQIAKYQNAILSSKASGPASSSQDANSSKKVSNSHT